METTHTMKRKGEHIRICLNEDVNSEGIDTGLGRYRFIHNALPEINFSQIDLSTEWLGHQLQTPLLISSMTGGTPETAIINERLAKMAEQRGWAIGLGSMRAALENESVATTFQIRKYAPSVPIIANIGAVQLNYGVTAADCLKLVHMAEASALVLHLNSMQEVFQPEGDTNFSDLLRKIEQLCHTLKVPVGVKEVGWGIDGRTAAKLVDAGVAFIDVAGAGGTSWSQVEKHRMQDPVRIHAAETFANWGIATADSIIDVREHVPQTFVVASGGMRSGVDVAKALALGAHLAGFGRTLLKGAAAENDMIAMEQLQQQFQTIEFELKATMFGIGVASIEELRHTDRIHLR
ncbi:type 2 isopentenyl-diphosphate Delta-isomerase [Paenibacillus yanchengensis]|uniref:Isopentenyl-diphosphate delta-isomerase n=1 Tax=Paenibacillus yanchengensis TaxID=2035833 RepID=A0ABW4YLH1_9BACL